VPIASSAPTQLPFYRPYSWAAADFQLGLRPFDPRRWILPDANYAQTMCEKRERLAAHTQIYYRTLASSLPAQRELCERVIAHLVTDYPEHFVRSGSVIESLATGIQCDLRDHSLEPLLQLSNIIEEDFMLIEEIDGAARITAAANAYSSSGRLVASVGRNIEWAHEPVPNLTDKLGPRINRVIGSVHAATPCERFNWQLTPMSTVFFPHDNPHAANAAAMQGICATLRRNPELAGELLWIRVERQTLSRLPDSRAVAFSLHTYSDPLLSIQSDVKAVRAMLALLHAYSEERWKYTEMDILREPIINWLESAANRPT
jgi:dimethylamine monooxygenase subunit A